MEDFLWSALEAPEVQTLMQQNAFLETNSYKLSPIRGMEIRTETNQLDPHRQDFALRINPANPWEIKRNNEYFQTYQEVIGLDQDRKLKELLTRHYAAIIGWSYLQEQKKLKQEEQEITQSLLQILEAQRFSSFFDADDYADLKIDLLEKHADLEELNFEEEILRKEIESLFPLAKSQDIAWSMASLVPVELIEQWIQRHEARPENGEIAYRQKLVELASAEWALAKSNLNIGFVQAQYQQYRLEQERSPWSIGLGVRLPLFNPNKGKMAEKKLDILEAQGELTQAQDEQEAGLSLMKTKVRTLTQRYHSLQEQMESLDMEGLGENLNAIQGGNPLAELRLRRSLVKSKNVTARLKRDIYHAYIEYLAETELLQSLPMVNYLQSDSLR
ncbi:hypothetical protein GCM10009119_01600 [Algoriphagus jejuensis]|uniref:Outer membrane protein TolC n=2 Tax=Algoriphagus jejuensis TaxID=419934 RepID=A0ABN1MV12_9BACT